MRILHTGSPILAPRRAIQIQKLPFENGINREKLFHWGAYPEKINELGNQKTGGKEKNASQAGDQAEKVRSTVTKNHIRTFKAKQERPGRDCRNRCGPNT